MSIHIKKRIQPKESERLSQLVTDLGFIELSFVAATDYIRYESIEKLLLPRIAELEDMISHADEHLACTEKLLKEYRMSHVLFLHMKAQSQKLIHFYIRTKSGKAVQSFDFHSEKSVKNNF